MDPSPKILFSLLSIASHLFSTATANNSSIINAYSSFGSTPVKKINANDSLDNYNQHIVEITKDAETYLTSPWLTRFVPSIHTVVIILSLPLNIIAILVFIIKIKLKKPAVIYMLNLASADVLLVSVLPFKVAYRFSGNNWAFGPEMCRFVTATFYCNMYCSILLMMVISIDRFLAVVYPIQSLSWRTLRRASLVCFAIWLLAIAEAMPLLVTEQTKRVFSLNVTTCLDTLDFSVIMETFRYYFSVVSILGFFIPLLISVTCYVCIIKKLSTSSAATKPGKRGRAILLSAAVLCSFIVCFGPTNVLLLVQGICISPDEPLESLNFAYLLAVCAGTINCCIDPLIYYYASSGYQRQVWRLLCYKKHSELEKGSQTTSSNVASLSTDLNNLSLA
ncbi:proteinase-activated receptor 1-like [Rhineura floridana]|uniref:proteinase-activated receptor 1-like n=1 Tax=Rhineura floridana TaxID=261503 RepID=UPI002AC81A46|nr:proteinase-activated receptor 1-like [Rhineura floridana]XP_061463447.1 proteinase-activated receptor 1-like [Rhineura floridana]